MPSGVAHLGLDFGMTNSLLVVWDAKSGPTPFKSSASSTYVVPTIVDAPEKSNAERLWGIAAWLLPRFFDNFKIGLPRAGALSADERERDKDFRAARAFLESLFEDFRETGGYDRIGSLVVTVPETWVRGGEQSGCDALLEICRTLELPQPRFLSEPVAAGCYFAQLHHDRTGDWFDGHALVYDHGGGTLDIAVTRIKGTEVRVVDGIGRSRDKGERGFGGVEFDRLVLERVSRRVPDLERMKGDERKEWLTEFEQRKRQAGVQIAKHCMSPKYEQLKSEHVFAVKGTSILLSDLIEPFEQVFAPPIEQAIVQILQRARELDGADIRNAERFRVIAVGGFSEFYPVQKLIARVINRETGNPDVMRNYLSRDEKWLAIAKGASLSAAGQIMIDERCPFTFGVVCWRQDARDYVDLIRLGEPLALYREPRFREIRFQLAQLDDSHSNSMQFYIEQGGNRVSLPMKRTFNEVLPEFGLASRWTLGAQVVDGAVIVIIRSDPGGSPRTVRMGELFTLVDGRLDEIFAD